QNWIALVPQGERETQVHLIVTPAEQSVLAPAIRPRASVVVRERVPGIAVSGVVLANRPPLALGQVRPPAIPGDCLVNVCLSFASRRRCATAGLDSSALRIDRIEPLRIHGTAACYGRVVRTR